MRKLEHMDLALEVNNITKQLQLQTQTLCSSNQEKLMRDPNNKNKPAF